MTTPRRLDPLRLCPSTNGPPRKAGLRRFRPGRPAVGRCGIVTGACALLLGAVVAVSAGSITRLAADPTPATICPQSRGGGAAARRTSGALASRRDVLGERLLAAPGGPSLAAARALLPPLFNARGPHQSKLTHSGAYYLAFSEPVGPQGAGAVALHLADGSQILAQRVGGSSLSVGVGAAGLEPFGSCRARLATPALADGYLPILETRYRDAAGATYRQESFSATTPAIHGLVSFVALRVDARDARQPVAVRFTLSPPGRRGGQGRLASGGDLSLLFTPGGRLDGSSLLYEIPRGAERTVYVAFPNRPMPTGKLPALARLYRSARRTDVSYWQRRLDAGASIVVPEPEVVDAERALLIQNLELGYRYSVGNPYQEFSFPETIDVARVMGEWGFATVDRAILDLSLSRPPTPYPNWTRGAKLVGVAEDYDLFGDRTFLTQVTPRLARYVAIIGRELSTRDDLLPREQYSSDIPLEVYGLPAQAVVWEGLEAMARVWADTGHRALARRCASLAARLHAGLERAVAASERRLPDGSLFVPVMLLAAEDPYGSLTRSRLGSYWNLDMPYALGSGFFRAGSTQARGILAYMMGHGALIAGLVRAGAYSLYGRHAAPPVSGSDEVYGLELARFLADNDEAGELVLSLYAQLADAMTPGTFVSGEAASIAPLPGTSDRAMYLPPNSAADATFLETLRLTLVNEIEDGSGTPEGLELGYATPRRWLLPERSIHVRDLPTSFGPLSFAITAARRSIRVELEPTATTPRTLRLRLRLPDGERIIAVRLGGRPYRGLDAATGTIDLSGLSGRIELTVSLS